MSQKKTQLEKGGQMDGPQESLSVCDIMHSNANSIIERLESLLPANMQLYSELYMECLHSMQDLFGACYISENEILSRMGLSGKTIHLFSRYAEMITKLTTSQMEMSNNVQKMLVQNQITAIKTSDEFIRLMLDGYSKILAGSLNIMKRQ